MSVQALIGTRKGLFSLDHEGQIKLEAFLGDPVTMVLASKDQCIWYAALNLGHFGVKLQRSDNSGKDWAEINAPAYPATEDPTKGDVLELLWSLEFADPSNPECLWAGSVPGGLFYSEDGGHHWQLNQPLWQFAKTQQWFGGGFDHAGIHSICVDPRDSAQVKVAISCAGVWCTRDGGASWQNQSKGMRAEYMPPEQAYDPQIQDPHRLVQCAGSPDTHWVQHHNGIFRSTDNSENWHEFETVEPSRFGFAVAVHPQDPDTAWFVPGVKDECRVPVDASLSVTRTRDGGKSFQSLSQGLPQSHCYDLVLRHALDVDSTGNALLMGSTTGNLWLSADQGETWQNISNHLPPIYCVRFMPS